MRQCFLILVALLPCVALNAGVKRPGSPAFDPQQSAALFVGISNFDDQQLEKVPYAIDDAVDKLLEVGKQFAFTQKEESKKEVVT